MGSFFEILAAKCNLIRAPSRHVTYVWVMNGSFLGELMYRLALALFALSYGCLFGSTLIFKFPRSFSSDLQLKVALKPQNSYHTEVSRACD